MNWIGIISTALTVVNILVCVLLIFVVLLQRPKNEGLGAAFGGDTASNIFGAQTTNVLANITRWLGGLFLGLSLIIAILGTIDPHRKSAVSDYVNKAAADKKAAAEQKKAEEAAKEAAQKAAEAAKPAAATPAGALPVLNNAPAAPGATTDPKNNPAIEATSAPVPKPQETPAAPAPADKTIPAPANQPAAAPAEKAAPATAPADKAAPTVTPAESKPAEAKPADAKPAEPQPAPGTTPDAPKPQ